MKNLLGYLATLALTLGTATAAASDAPAASIATSFEAFWHAAQGLPFEQQETLWDRYIEQPRQELYDWVVWEKRDYPAWQKEKDYALKARFAAYAKIGDRIPAAAASLDTAIPAQVARFRTLFPDAPAKPAVAVVLAPDFDSRTGVLQDGTPVLALSIDTLLLEKADPDILFPHELFHLYDARHAGITNDGVMPGTKLTLPLFEEGLATYVSTRVTPGRTDGEYLLQASLGALPASRLPEVARRFLAEADAPTIDPTRRSMAFGRWFEGNDKPYQADLPNRSGYWLGLNLIRQMAKTHGLPEMASWGPTQAQEQTLAALRQMAGGK
ncbi:MAG TPA: hypothetical protein VGV16_06960 [Gammaproteobacteria bacterium]|nr:hypothetical protein [Gammaproteobacteria bacterium]